MAPVSSSEFDLAIPDEINLDLSGKFNIRSSIKLQESRITNLSKVLRSNKPTLEFSDILDKVLQDAIKSSIWATRNGVDDIISSGELLRSGTVSISNANSISISYDVPYASLVHYGGYIIPYGNSRANRVYIPPRPWVAEVLAGQYAGFNPIDVYREIIIRTIQATR